MKDLKSIAAILSCFVALTLFSVSTTYAQGNGQGQGQGNVNNAGCEHGQGFSIGQGHLNGNSAVDCDDSGNPCLSDAISQVETSIVNSRGGTIISTTTIDANTFSVIWDDGSGRGCVETTAEATGDPSSGCGFFILSNAVVPCP